LAVKPIEETGLSEIDCACVGDPPMSLCEQVNPWVAGSGLVSLYGEALDFFVEFDLTRQNVFPGS